MAESEKDQIIRKLKAENKGLQEQIAYLRRKLFDHKSEALNPNQTSLFDKGNSVFNEPEQTGDQSSSASNQVRPKKSKKRRGEKK
ncbi:transposase (plasmid) [Lactiplantibacillus pentosus]|nr:transposase [Lactiplantibacillus pentosus]